MGFCFVSLFPPFFSSFLFFSFFFFFFFFFGGGRTASVFFLGGHGPRWPPLDPPLPVVEIITVIYSMAARKVFKLKPADFGKLDVEDSLKLTATVGSALMTQVWMVT